MQSQMAQIGITQTPSTMEIRQPKAEIKIKQPKADLSIDTLKGKLTIDQTQAWEETNLKSALRWTETYATEGKQAIKEGTARRAEQGSELSDIHLDRNVMADQAIQNGHPKMKMLSIAYIPSPFSVKIHYEPAVVQINATTNKPIIDVQVNKPELNAHPGNVAIAIEQYADLTIDVE